MKSFASWYTTGGRDSVTGRVLLVTLICIPVLSHAPLLEMPSTTAWNAFQVLVALLLGLLTTIAATVRSDPRRTLPLGLVVLLAAFLAIAGLSALTSDSPARVLSQAAFSSAMLVPLALVAFLRWMDRNVALADLQAVTLVLAFICAFSVVLGIVDPELGIGPYERLKGLYTNANYLGACAALVIVLSAPIILRANRLQTILLVGGVCFALVAILWSGSRGSVLAATVGMVGVVASTRRWKLVLATITACIALLLAVQFMALSRFVGNDFTSGRFDLFSDAIDIWTESPWLGVGFRTFETHTNGLTTHNILLSTLVETGPAGFAVFVAILVMVFVRGRLLRWFGPALTVVAIEQTESTMFGWAGPTAIVFWVVLLAHATSRSPRDRLVPTRADFRDRIRRPLRQEGASS